MIVSIQDAPTATQTYRGVAYGLVLSVAPLFLYQRQDP
jgi:hypothetical protein